MTQAIYIAVAVTTIAFLVISFTTDLRERMIYSFPCLMLALSWCMLGFTSIHNVAFIMTIILLHLLAYSLMRIFRIWGDGDTDVFLLYGAVYAAFGIHAFGTESLCIYLIGELMGMVAALLLSFLIGFIEARVRKKKLSRSSSIAVVPGFAIVMAGLIIGSFIVR